MKVTKTDTTDRVVTFLLSVMEDSNKKIDERLSASHQLINLIVSADVFPATR